MIWLLTLLITSTQVWAGQPATVYIDHGYALLAQAHQAPQPTQRERLLYSASKVFSNAYQLGGGGTKVEALLGAAQVYLLMQHPPKVFPFIWSAPPLQRAEKSVQQALVLEANNGAAALLMGIVLWRQAAALPARHTTLLQRSSHYLDQAASSGLPVQLPGQGMSTTSEGIPRFTVDTALRTLQYVDTRDSGRREDLLFCYRTQTPTQHYGVIIIMGQAYSLSTAASTGTIQPADEVEACEVMPRPDGPPIVTAVVQHAGRQVHRMFRWNGSTFAFVGEQHIEP